MNRRFSISVSIVVVGFLLISTYTPSLSLREVAVPNQPEAIGTGFTYQGRLNEGGVSAHGSYDFRFSLFNALTGGTQVGTTVSKEDVTVENGIFSVQLDYGSVFTEQALWLEVQVRPGATTGSYTPLTPRQPLTAVPFASYASNADQLDGQHVSAFATAAHDHLGETWTGSDNSLVITGTFGAPYTSTLVLGNSGGDAISIPIATNTGVIMNSVGNGVGVISANNWGVVVGLADVGLGVWFSRQGLFVLLASEDGINVDGNNFAGYFRGPIQVEGGCIGCAQLVFGLNASDQSLHPGQVVSIQGMDTAALDNATSLWQVVPAGMGQTPVGVVSGRAEQYMARSDEELQEGQTGTKLVPREGTARPGEYLTIIIDGPMQVQAGQEAAAIQPGMRLATGEDGLLRPLRTVKVEGIELAENAPILGIALSKPDENGLVWVLVNPR